MNENGLIDQTPFINARGRIQSLPWFDSHWICNAGLWFDSASPQGAVLKLLKPHWSNDLAERIRNTSGIFFSVWTDCKIVDRLNYNIHALKLRELKGYSLESRKFAAAFRAAFEPMWEGWPNLRVDFGPQTLMQGYQKVSADCVENAIVDFSEKFVPVAEVIDVVLEKYRHT